MLIAASISSAVVVRPRLKRRLDRASSGESPIAVSTCDGSIAPEEHAAPVDDSTPKKIERDHKRFSVRGSKRQIRVFEMRRARSPFTRTLEIAAKQRFLQPVAKRTHTRGILRQPSFRNFRRLAEPSNSSDILRSRTAVALVMPAVHLRLERRAGANVQRAHSLRPINLVRRNRKENLRRAHSRPTATCQRTESHRNENKRPHPRRLRQFPRSAESCRVRYSRASR